jgi:hypothetical protein
VGLAGFRPPISMNSTTSLSGSHLSTYERIFQHPISHNLEWREVHAMFKEPCDVEKESNGNLKVTRNGHSLVLHSTSDKDVTEMDEVMALRHFLERSESPQGTSSNAQPTK